MVDHENDRTDETQQQLQDDTDDLQSLCLAGQIVDTDQRHGDQTEHAQEHTDSSAGNINTHLRKAHQAYDKGNKAGGSEDQKANAEEGILFLLAKNQTQHQQYIGGKA